MLTKTQSMPAHMASIHLRSMTRATPSRMASTSSRPHSLPSQMARCKHQSHSLIDIPRPEREGLADPPCYNTQSFAHRAYRDGHRQVSTGTALTATNARTPTLRPHRPPVEDASSGSRAPPLGSQPLGCVLASGASSWFSRSGPPLAHPCVRQGHHPRACQVLRCPAIRVRPRRSADPQSPGSPSSIPSQESSCRQPRTSETPSPWRNVGAVLGSIGRLTEGPPKASWAPSMGLLDPASHIWGVRHHAPPPVSEWCS